MKATRLFHEPRRPGPGRPRRSATGHAILKATREILAQGGVHGLTVEGVAERSGVAKTTIYRRWRSKEDLALAALLEVIREEPPPRYLGSTEAALTAYLGQLVKNVNSKLYGRILRGLISEMAVDPVLARGFREQVLARRIAAITALLVRGIERGELRPNLDMEIAIDLLLGPIYYRLLMSGKPLTRAFVDRLIRAAMAYGSIGA
ncbi:MAG TPA: TetR/AcrR family transcriptional regulator [Candidatus Angelobacter sp.]|nr:TetR/AcrR family transcriptional regulator [Candidatus Angelobacter sp.]